MFRLTCQKWFQVHFKIVLVELLNNVLAEWVVVKLKLQGGKFHFVRLNTCFIHRLGRSTLSAGSLNRKDALCTRITASLVPQTPWSSELDTHI